MRKHQVPKLTPTSPVAQSLLPPGRVKRSHSLLRKSWEDGEKHWWDILIDANDEGFAPFDAWAKFKQEETTQERKLSAKSAAQYRHTWQIWLKYLQSRMPAVTWRAAGPSDVAGFLSNIRPSANGKQKASPVSRARYRSILNNVYQHAVREASTQAAGAQLVNPVEGVCDSEGLRATETSQSLRLTADSWGKLVQRLPVEPIVDEQIRDTAMLTLIMFDAFSVSDLVNMKLSSVSVVEGSSEDIGERSPQVLIEIADTAGRPGRLARVSERSALALRRWLAARGRRPGAWVAYVFIPMRQAMPLHPKSVFMIVQEFIASACQDETSGSELPAHMGPNVLRNSCIQRWVEVGVPFTEIARRAGLKGTMSLRRLIGPADKATRERFSAENKAARAQGQQQGPKPS